VGGEYKGAASEGAAGECGCRCGFKSRLIVGRDEERDRLVGDGINVGVHVEALTTHSQIIPHVGISFSYPISSCIHHVQSARNIIHYNKHQRGPTSTPQRDFLLYRRPSQFLSEFLIDLLCTARTYRFTVHPSSQSLLMYGTTTCKEWRWRDPCGVAILDMVHIHTSTSDERLTYHLPDSSSSLFPNYCAT
jgi:hypothetical protein